MAQFKAFEEGIEVNGQTITAVVAGLGGDRAFAIRCFERAGLSYVISDDRHWYPQQAWLDTFRIIADELGDDALFRIGAKIPENAVFPDDIDGIVAALDGLDIAYHVNHRNARGEVLFDPARPGRMMLDGIGHYAFRRTGERSASMLCANPYPCAFDRGIIQALARRFEPLAETRHVDGEECRTLGGASCTYTVTW